MATTESVSFKLSELPSVWANSKRSWASWRAEMMEVKKEVARISASFGMSAKPDEGATGRSTFGAMSKRLRSVSMALTIVSNS